MVINQATSASQASEQRYRHLFEQVPICLFVSNLRANPATILEANRRAEVVYGYAAADLVGMPISHLAPNEARPAIERIVERVKQGQRVKVETTGQRRDGTRFSIRVIATRDPADDSLMIVTIEDITAETQRRTEAEAIDAERRRIAHEIHDGVVQSLAGLRFKSALWSHLAEAASPDIRAALHEFQTVLIAAIVDMRRSIFGLRPLALDTAGFFPALQQIVTDFGDQNQVMTELEVSGSQNTLAPAYELPVLRVIREALNNVGQHAQASLVLVRLMMDETGGATVSVRDNGCGFDPRQLGLVDHKQHFGLRQMRERITDLDGTLEIRSTLGQGTELLITLPPLVEDVSHAPNQAADHR